MDDASTERRQAATAMRIRTKRRLGSVLAVSSFAAGALAIGAFATPPGTNGGIAFKRYFDTSHSRAATSVSSLQGAASRRLRKRPLVWPTISRIGRVTVR